MNAKDNKLANKVLNEYMNVPINEEGEGDGYVKITFYDLDMDTREALIKAINVSSKKFDGNSDLLKEKLRGITLATLSGKDIGNEIDVS